MLIKALIVLIVIIVVSFAALIARAKIMEMRRTEKITANVNDVVNKLLTDSNSVESEVRKLAENPVYRNALYERLKSVGKLNYFPKEFLTQEALAESNLVSWLSHPNELNAVPDKIELVTKIKKELPGNNSKVEFFVFRFRVNEPHWAAKDGWMAGITGPFTPGSEIKTHSMGSFSELEPFDTRTPADHVDYLLSKQSSILVSDKI